MVRTRRSVTLGASLAILVLVLAIAVGINLRPVPLVSGMIGAAIPVLLVYAVIRFEADSNRP